MYMQLVDENIMIYDLLGSVIERQKKFKRKKDDWKPTLFVKYRGFQFNVSPVSKFAIIPRRFRLSSGIYLFIDENGELSLNRRPVNIDFPSFNYKCIVVQNDFNGTGITFAA